MTAWIVRAGRLGERDDWALEHGLAGGGWEEVPDLTPVTTRDNMATLVNIHYPGDSSMSNAVKKGQLWAMRERISPGDVIVLPMKTTKKIALGVCIGGYEYLSDVPDITKRHVLRVDWKQTDISRAAIKDDLLHTINGAMTVFKANKNNAEARLRAVMQDGVDPGVQPGQVVAAPSADDDAVPVDPNPAVDLDSLRDRVRTHLVENFGSHKLTQLVAEILEAQGYVCTVSPPGPDFSVDIIAGRGPLGLDSPTLIVQVKAVSNAVGAPVVNELLGAMRTHTADQGLLVAWAGVTPQARSALRTERLTVRTWDSEDVLDQLFDHYGDLPEGTRSLIPLKKVWVLLEENG